MNDIVQAIKTATVGKTRPLVFMCGPGSAGKSTLCDFLAQPAQLGGVIVRSDWYLIHPSEPRKQRIAEALASGDPLRIEREENSFNWYDWDRIAADLNMLQVTGSLEMTDGWNQATGEKDLHIKLQAEPDTYIFVDGIYLKHEPLVDLADVVVTVQVDMKIARDRSAQRDGHRSTAEYLDYKNILLRQKYVDPYFDKWGWHGHISIDNNNLDAPKIIRI